MVTLYYIVQGDLATQALQNISFVWLWQEEESEHLETRKVASAFLCAGKREGFPQAYRSELSQSGTRFSVCSTWSRDPHTLASPLP